MANNMGILSIPSLFSGLKALQALGLPTWLIFHKVLLSKKKFKQFLCQLFIIQHENEFTSKNLLAVFLKYTFFFFSFLRPRPIYNFTSCKNPEISSCIETNKENENHCCLLFLRKLLSLDNELGTTNQLDTTTVKIPVN